MPVYMASSSVANGWVLALSFLIVLGIGLYLDLSKGRKS